MAGCMLCCGCTGCVKTRRGYYSPEGVRIGHGEHVLHAVDWVHITGRGDVALIGAFPSELGDPRELTGQHVVIDGRRYLVRDTDTFRVPDARRHPFGLLVKEDHETDS